MKKQIHPAYFPKATFRCACGNVFVTGATKEMIETEICAKCHPFYTGQEKVLDTLGRVQKFKDKLAKKSDKPKKGKKIKARKVK